MPIYALGDLVPEISADAFVHPDAVVIGSVLIGAHATVWPTAVLRGDYGAITIGERTSIQDGTIIHATKEHPTIVGDDCVVGHNVHLEGCTIEHHVLIGSVSTVLHSVIVRARAVVAAGAVVLPETEVPSEAMALGVPAKVRLGAAKDDYVSHTIRSYVANGKHYKAELRRID